MTIGKKIARGALIALLLLIIVALVIELFYLPSYLLGDERVEPKDGEDGEITVMSCNVRYFNPLDHERIDYIFISDADAEVLEYRIVDNLHGDVYASDHAPIYTRMKTR